MKKSLKKQIADIFGITAFKEDTLESIFKRMDREGKIDQKAMIRIIAILCNRIERIKD